MDQTAHAYTQRSGEPCRAAACDRVLRKDRGDSRENQNVIHAWLRRRAGRIARPVDGQEPTYHEQSRARPDWDPGSRVPVSGRLPQSDHILQSATSLGNLFQAHSTGHPLNKGILNASLLEGVSAYIYYSKTFDLLRGSARFWDYCVRMGTNPAQAMTGKCGYLGNRGSTADNRQR